MASKKMLNNVCESCANFTTCPLKKCSLSYRWEKCDLLKGSPETARKVEEKNRKQFRKICVDLLHEIWDNRDYYAPILN